MEVGGRSFDSRFAEYDEGDSIQLVREKIVEFRELVRLTREENWDQDGSCKRRLENILGSERNWAIERISGHGFNRVGQQKFFSGVMPRLKKNLWPWDDGDPKHRGRKRAPPDTKSPYFDVTGLSRSCSKYGDVHGSAVSDELEVCVRAVRKEEDVDLRSADPCTARILDCLYNAGWIPMAAELQVWDSPENVATALDLLAVDAKRAKLVAIEVKTGYENEEYGPLEQDPPLLDPFRWLRDCPEHRHQLQLAATVHILERGYEEKIDESYVLQACSKRRGVLLMKSPEWTERPEAKEWIAQALRK